MTENEIINLIEKIGFVKNAISSTFDNNKSFPDEKWYTVNGMDNYCISLKPTNETHIWTMTSTDFLDDSYVECSYFNENHYDNNTLNENKLKTILAKLMNDSILAINEAKYKRKQLLIKKIKEA